VLHITVTSAGQAVSEFEIDGPVELGRQQSPAEAYPSCGAGPPRRIVVAPLDEKGVSRRHAVLEPSPDGGITVRNLSGAAGQTGFPIQLNGRPLEGQAAGHAGLPALLRFGPRVVVRVDPVQTGGSYRLESLAERSIAPFSAGRSVRPLSVAVGNRGDVESVLRWLGDSIDVFQSAASSDEFFDRAAAALVEAVGLDCGRVLLREGAGWRTKALRLAREDAAFAVRPPSSRVLKQVSDDPDTIWEIPAADDDAGSLIGVEAIIVSPILDRDGKVIGALYGDRRGGNPGMTAGPAISRVDATLVRLLASAVAAGLARLHEEEAALTARGRFDQFFTPELSKRLAEDPGLVERGRDAEVTVLFCDVRGYSGISERLGPAVTTEWLNAVMNALSVPIREEEGVLVDYIGDELIAMWGAPDETQTDHAQRACRAALKMLAALEAVDAEWRDRIGGVTKVGIGINTGPARVGNTGSKYKFKYGPLGNTVNLASRLQGATKYLRARCLLTEATRRFLGPEFHVRRLCRVRVVNIVEPVTLYELVPAVNDRWPVLRDRYEAALHDFQQGRFAAAAESLGRLAAETPDDGPSRILLRRAAEWMLDPDREFDDVWDLPGK